MYRYTVHNLKDGGELSPPGPDYMLQHVVYASPERLIAVWLRAGMGLDVGWGETVYAVEEVPVG